MENRKRAWAYCSIDAPEDIHGALKKQRQQIVDYAEQMGFEVVGSSSDVGNQPLWERTGFRHFAVAAKKKTIDILLIVNLSCLSRSSMQLAQFQALAKGYGIQTYSPLEGAIVSYQ